jgi:uncharacterized protein YjbI with pentapeptide repeats
LLSLSLSLSFAIAVAIVLTGAGGSVITIAGAGAVIVTIIFTVITPFTVITYAVAILLLSFYVAWRVVNEDEKFAVARAAGLWLGSLGGTSFQHADLADATFSGATLNNCNFSQARVLRTDFRNCLKLDRAKRTGTILDDIAVRKLLVTGQGNQQDYRGKNLKGACLIGADLGAADLTEADISGASLENADLTGANLTKIQALGSNFKGTVLTGACIESWHIDSTTQLDGVVCDYVYLLNGQRERRPNSGTFGSGEFSKLFEEVLDTVDLIFKNGIDWKAFQTAFNDLKVTFEDADIQVQSITNKGDGVFVVRLATPPGIDKAAVHNNMMQDYEHQIKLLDAKYQAKLEAKQEIIDDYRQKNTDLMEIVKASAQRPITVHATATAGENNKNTHVGGNVSHAVLNQGDISGEITQSSTDQDSV